MNLSDNIDCTALTGSDSIIVALEINYTPSIAHSFIDTECVVYGI